VTRSGTPTHRAPERELTSENTEAARATSTNKRIPDFFIVGQPKSGTTALYDMLKRHPQIYMPDNKEPWFFADELHFRTPPRPGGTPRNFEEYLSLFDAAKPEQRVGEASVLYMWSRSAAGRIAEAQPAARVIAVLREPASLLRSLHLQFLQTYVETETDLRKALALEDARREGRDVPRNTYWPQALLYSDHVRYVDQLRRFQTVLGPEQMLVLLYDDFRADNEATVRTVLRFLEVDDTAPIEVMQAKQTVTVRSRRLHGLLHKASVGSGPISRAASAVTPRGVRRALRRANSRTDPQPVDEQLMLELRRRYKREVAALGEYLDRDLIGLWGYDSVD
jgi:hypothetical protein